MFSHALLPDGNILKFKCEDNMHTNKLVRLGGMALIIAGAFYIGDTLADWLVPGNKFAIGTGVSCFALLGLPVLYFSILKELKWFGILGYVITSMGLTGLAGVSLFNNIMRPILEPEIIKTLFEGLPLIYFIGTGVLFLIGGIFLSIAVWQSGELSKKSAILYLAGCVPVSLPPLFPTIAPEVGAVAISLALISWGIVMVKKT